MLTSEKKIITVLVLLLSVGMLVFTFLDWSVDGFELFKAQQYEFYFQSWVSIAGISFTLIMAVTTFMIYKKTKLASLKFMSLSFLLTALAYLSIGYHSTYCKVCSDLAICSGSHNYSNYFIVIALVTFVLSVLLMSAKNNISILKLFANGLIVASSVLLMVLFISIEFMEIPGSLFYEINQINLQGFVFVFPLFLIAFSYIYFRKKYKMRKMIGALFLLLSLSFIPQAYHTFLCEECHTMECSEFYIVAGLMMFIALGLFIYSLGQQLKEEEVSS